MFCLCIIYAFTNTEPSKSSILLVVSDSTLIAKIINVTSQFKDTIYQYDLYDYDFKATEDSIKTLTDSLKTYPEKQDQEFNKAYKAVQKSILTDTNTSFVNFINQNKLLTSLVNKTEKDTVEIKIKLKKLNNTLTTLKNNREQFDKIILAPKKEVLSSVSNIQNPLVLKVEYWNSKFKVIIVNSQTNDLNIIPNNSGVRKTIMSQYARISKYSYGVLMNAGMFEEDGSGVGLLISNRKKVNDINLKKNLPGNFYSLTNAIYFRDTAGKNYIKITKSFNEKYKNGNYPDIAFATQSGPALLIDGKINTELNIRSQNSLIRNGVGVVKNANSNITIFIISETPTTFYELASLFNFLGCDNAMYLDGTISQLLSKGPNNKIEETSRARTQTLGPIFTVTSKEMKNDTIVKKINNKKI
jgi:uncharacterized protein YigE (DUF2233 family)